jgi:hypothetical protein
MLKPLAQPASVEDMNLSPDWVDVLTAEGWKSVQLGNGPSAEDGAGRACPHHGADEPETHSGLLHHSDPGSQYAHVAISSYSPRTASPPA